MNHQNFSQNIIKALAYFHRYGWIVVMLFCMEMTSSLYTMGLFMIAHSIWTLLGYFLKWKHIFCSFQNAYHMKMTPNHVNWGKVRKADVYGVPAIFFIIGLVNIIVLYFYPFLS